MGAVLGLAGQYGRVHQADAGPHPSGHTPPRASLPTALASTFLSLCPSSAIHLSLGAGEPAFSVKS